MLHKPNIMELSFCCKLNFDEDSDDNNSSSPASPVESTNHPTDVDMESDSSFQDTSSTNFKYPQRKLTFCENFRVPSPSNSISPPDKKIRSLRLFDSPNTPKTLLKSSMGDHHQSDSSPQLVGHINTPFGFGMESTNPIRNIRHSQGRPTSRSRLFLSGSSATTGSSTLGGTRFSTSSVNTESSSLNSSELEGEKKDMRANVNPFTPDNIMMSGKKRSRRKLRKSRSDSLNSSLLNNNLPSSKNNNSSSTTASTTAETSLLSEGEVVVDHHHMEEGSGGGGGVQYASSSDDEDDYEDDGDNENPSKRIAMHEVNVSRYHKEFVELKVVGKGVFGSVYLCRHRLDGCLYAIKKSRRPVSGSADERRAMNEVYAHAVLGAHEHVVRYYSAWAEDDHMIIQNEYCNGSSLAQSIEHNRKQKKTLNESQLKLLCRHVAKGLKYIHSLYLAHLDIKPENIFIAFEKVDQKSVEDSKDDGFEDDHLRDDRNTVNTYKIGDLGHVTSIMNPKVEEGDCRYMARELLADDYSALDKVDIFALGLTLYEAASGVQLPRNGEVWQNLRDGHFDNIPGISADFNQFMRKMIHSDPNLRPSAEAILSDPVMDMEAPESKTKQQLGRELELAKMKNEYLEQQLEQANFILKKIARTQIGQSSPQRHDVPVPVPVFTGPTPIEPIPDEGRFSSVMIRSPSPPPLRPYNTRSSQTQLKTNCKITNSRYGSSKISSSNRFVGKTASRSHSIF